MTRRDPGGGALSRPERKKGKSLPTRTDNVTAAASTACVEALRKHGRKWTTATGTTDAQPTGVRGAITSRDVLLHSVTILRLWGPACYVRCLRAIVSRRTCTFLEVIAGS